MRAPTLLAAVITLAGCSDVVRTPTSDSPKDLPNVLTQQVDTLKHVFLARGIRIPASEAITAGVYAPLGPLTYHNGVVLTASGTFAVFWGTSWGTDPTFTADKITGLETFFRGFGGSNYTRTLREYYWIDHPNGDYEYNYMTPSSQFRGSFIDNNAAPGADPGVSALVNEVASVLSRNGVAPVRNALYSVYATTPRGGADYCAWHSSGTIAGVPITVAWYFNVDGDASCDPSDASGLHSQGLAALANLTAHELSETITDPYPGGGWYATSLAGENADKCAWVFNVPLVTLNNGAQYKIQGNWSNKAYNSGYGYQNRDGELGCLSGQTFPHVVSSIDCCANGPSQATIQQLCWSMGSAIGGTPPYTYVWQNEGPNYNVVPPSGTGSAFQTEVYTPAPHFTLRLVATDAAGVKDTTRFDVRPVTTPVNGCT